jgi:hypothetical protein
MNTQSTRILAVEIRAARMGYAVIESPKELKDFGGAWFPYPKAARSRIARLLRLYGPSVLVLASAAARYPRDARVRKLITRIVRDEARKSSVPTIRVTDQEFDTFFNQYSCRDKYDVAAVLARKFPSLAWRVPPPPEFYDPEPRQMLYFDSIALGLVYLERSCDG